MKLGVFTVLYQNLPFDEGLGKAVSLLKGIMFKEQLKEIWWA